MCLKNSVSGSLKSERFSQLALGRQSDDCVEQDETISYVVIMMKCRSLENHRTNSQQPSKGENPLNSQFLLEQSSSCRYLCEEALECDY